MNILDIYEKIKVDYKDAQLINNKSIIINDQRSFDGLNCLYCKIVFSKDRYIITDNAEYLESIDYKYHHDEVLTILHEYDVKLDDGEYLITTYRDNSDIARFFDCVMELGKKHSFVALKREKEGEKAKKEAEEALRRKNFNELSFEEQKDSVYMCIKHASEPIRGKQISEALGINLSLAIRLAKALLEDGLIKEVERGYIVNLSH